MGSKPVVSTPSLFLHGCKHHESVSIDAYNSELKDADGFIGDRVSKGAFYSILEKRRQQVRQVGEDPLGDAPTDDIKKKDLEKLLTDGDLEAAGLVHGAIEEFAQELSLVANRLLKLKGWKNTERIVVGGGFSSGRAGELAIQRASVLLQSEHGHKVALSPIRHHPDEAGLLGNIHVLPAQMLVHYDSLLAVDIGGSNIRVGVVTLNQDKSRDFKDAFISSTELWRHADDSLDRDACIERLANMLETQIKQASKDDYTLAPMIGIACPGFIKKDGSIEKGAQNLPGNWESSRFNLPRTIQTLIPRIGENETIVTMHNDAVVQGLSETPWMQDITHWGVLTIGTGLGNARLTNRFQSTSKPRKPGAGSKPTA